MSGLKLGMQCRQLYLTCLMVKSVQADRNPRKCSDNYNGSWTKLCAGARRMRDLTCLLPCQLKQPHMHACRGLTSSPSTQCRSFLTVQGLPASSHGSVHTCDAPAAGHARDSLKSPVVFWARAMSRA